jgi:hypothetical protein
MRREEKRGEGGDGGGGGVDVMVKCCFLLEPSLRRGFGEFFSFSFSLRAYIPTYPSAVGFLGELPCRKHADMLLHIFSEARKT